MIAQKIRENVVVNKKKKCWRNTYMNGPLAGWPSDEEMIPANVADNFQWLTKDHLCILVYLVTVMHSMQVSFIFSSFQKKMSMSKVRSF